MIRNTISSLQLLRAIAAAMVLIAHEHNYLQARGYTQVSNSFYDFGSAGVDIFFIISGFIMVYVSEGLFQKRGSSLDFMIRRIIRVVPVYWIYTLGITLLLVVFPNYFSDGKQFESSHFIASMLFIPWENNVGIVRPVLGVGWTLSYEMYFYFVFSILLLFRQRYLLVGLSVWLISGILLGNMFGPDITVLSVINSPLVLEFLMGSAIGVLYLSKFKVTQNASIMLIMLSVLGFLITSSPFLAYFDISSIDSRVLKWGVPSTLLVAGFVFYERANNISISRLFIQLGNSSYSLYLTHIFTINAIGAIWSRVFSDYYGFFILITFVLSIIIGHMAYILIEKPVVGNIANFYRKKYSKL